MECSVTWQASSRRCIITLPLTKLLMTVIYWSTRVPELCHGHANWASVTASVVLLIYTELGWTILQMPRKKKTHRNQEVLTGVQWLCWLGGAKFWQDNFSQLQEIDRLYGRDCRWWTRMELCLPTIFVNKRGSREDDSTQRPELYQRSLGAL